MAISGTNQPDNLSYDGSTDETISGLNGNDSISTVDSTANNTMYGGNGIDTIHAGAGDDKIYGERGADIIYAGAGNDLIDGGQGDDTIETGEGNDTVVLTRNGGIDTVTDFRATYTSLGPDQTISFDDLGFTFDAPIPDGYGGFNWPNVYAFDPDTFFAESGYNNVGQGSIVAFDAFGIGGTVTTTGADFTLKSAYMAAAWNDDLEVTVQGWDDDVLVVSQPITLGVDRTLVNFVGFDSIDKVTFDGSGGTYHGFVGSGDHVALDDLTIAFETQTPSQDVIQVASQEVADGLLASAHDVAGGVALDYKGYHAVVLGQTAADVTADWFLVA
jgi:Ca2+-binding RTX toxin-like protein